jgi:glycosyltransferase involved in cell wall biosynthesis
MKTPNKSLVFDGQVFQTPAWHRGMGKYSMELIVALNELNQVNPQWKNIEVILSKRVETEKSVFDAFKEKAPEVKVTQLNLERNEYDNRPVANRNRKVMDDYFDVLQRRTRTMSTDYVVLSIMQSEVAPAFSALSSVRNYLLFYDLIPLMFHRTYLKDGIHQKSYLSKLAELLKADVYLAISKTVANDLAALLGIDKSRVISIDGAPIEHGHKSRSIDVPKPFILMPTGNDLRKNNRRGIESFKIFNQKNGNKFHLVVTSVFQDFEIEELKKISKKVIFTGNVSGEQLEYLYEQTDALLFPTEYEGLGLPILEALEKVRPVACSDISVFREISDDAFWYFDPRDVNDMARALDDAVSAKKLPLKEYDRVVKKFTWNRTAELFMLRAKQEPIENGNNDKDSVTIFCPSVDESGEGIKIQQLYSELVRICRPSFYMDTYGPKNEKSINYLVQIAGVLNIARPTKIEFAEETLPIYFIEDKPNCAAILITALANPGVLVLGAINLDALWQGAVDRGLMDGTRLSAEDKINEDYDTEGRLVSLIANQEKVIVHSTAHKDKLEKIIKLLPASSRPDILLLPYPSTELVYDELNQDLSLLDYQVTRVKGKKVYTYREYAEAIHNESRKSR